MVWYDLKVGSFSLKYTPLKPREVEFPYCDAEGNVLKRVVEGKGKVFFVNETTGDKTNFAFKLIRDKPTAKLSKTKEVSNYREVNEEEVGDLITEKEYLVDSDLLLNELENSGKALKFGFTFGNGFKVYKAYIHRNPLYKNFLFMSVGTTQKSEIITDITENMKQKKKASEVLQTISGIERARVEDLIEL